MAALSSAQASFLESFLSLTSKTILPLEGPAAAAISTTTSPFLPPPSAPSAPVWDAQSPRASATASIAAWTRSSKLKPLRVAGPLGFGDRLLAGAPLEVDAEALGQLADLGV